MAVQLNAQQIEVLNQAKRIIGEVKKVIIGKDEIIIKVLLAILAEGHILLEDVPGVGKTTLAMALSKALSLSQKRLQFTPDVMPTDVTGFSIYNKATGRFEYKEGSALCNLFLADEINRTSSKTQSALLEVMEEGRITVDGITREMPKPYTVIATQNPIGSIGTQNLPESQLDRFIIKLTMGYPDLESEIGMLKSKLKADPLDSVYQVATAQDIVTAQRVVEDIYIAEELYEYIARLTSATRTHPFIKLGVSPRGTIALSKMAQATALLRARDYVLPEDVSYVFKDVVAHRIILSAQAKMSGVDEDCIISEVMASVHAPKIV